MENNESNRLVETVTAAQNGNESALEKLYLEHAKRVYYLALKLMHDKEEAENVTQEVFIVVCKKIGDLKEPKTFPAWLNRITANKCTDFLRKRRVPMEIDIDELAETSVFEEGDPLLIPDKYVDNEETTRIIIDIIDNLPLPQRVCVYYYYYEHLTIAQISEILDTNDNAVKGRLYLAREKIRKELERLNKEEGIKLYSFAPLLLAPILRAPLREFVMPNAAGLWSNITAGAAIEAATVAATTATAAGGVAATSSAAAGTAVATGVSTKIILSVVGFVIACGAAAAVFFGNFKNEPVETPIETERIEVEIDFSRRGITNEQLAEMVASGEIPPNVTYLDLKENQISDISPLSQLPYLWGLCISMNPITDLSPLGGMTNLSTLYLNTQAEDLSPLGGLINMKHLNISFNGSDLSPLSGMANLITLYISQTPVEDLTPLSGMTNLLSLSILQTRVEDLTPLSGLTGLQGIYLASNPHISDITPLSGLTSLSSLQIHFSEVSDVSPLAGLPNLWTISLQHNPVTDITPLMDMPNLQRLIINNTPAYEDEEQIIRFRAALPDCEIR